MTRYLPLLAVAVVPTLLGADAPARPLAVTPAAVPDPALRFRLLPWFTDRVPGNAALEYHRALTDSPGSVSAAEKSQASDAAEGWVSGPPPAAVKRVLDAYAGSLRAADRAARCDRCEWELDARARENVMATPAGDIGGLRELGHYLGWRARAEIADGQFDAAARSFATAFQLARHVNRMPLLIHALVAASLAEQTLKEVEAWVARPGSPNLYWALTGLPAPFVDLRTAAELEAGFPDTILPDYRRLEQGPVSKAEAEKLVGGWIKGTIRSGTPDDLRRLGLDHPLAEVGLTAVLTLRYQTARKFLLAHGKPAAEVDAMPSLQVVYLYDLALFRRLRDDQMKWIGQPYPVARAGLRAAAERQNQVLADSWNDPLLKTFCYALPGWEKITLAPGRVDRRLAALRVVEAVRLHAAGHGHPPPSLDDLGAVPVPADPLTGRPFEYAVTGDTFTLTAPPPDGEPANPGNSLRYTVTVKGP
jgi:hypothetical protein